MFNGREMSKLQNITISEEQNSKSAIDKEGSYIKNILLVNQKKQYFLIIQTKETFKKNIIIQIISLLKKFYLEHKFYFLYSSI